MIRSATRTFLASILVLAAACGGEAPPPATVAAAAPAAPDSGLPAPAAAPGGGTQATLTPTPPQATELPPPTALGQAKPPVDIVAPAPEGNPFTGKEFYRYPRYSKLVDEAAKTMSAGDAALMKKVEAFPVAIWLESIERANTVSKVLDDVAAVEKKTGKPQLAVFIVYDLPERDCAAVASAGELTIDKGGEKRYEKEFIDKIAAGIKAHPKLHVVAVLEPDSLPNLATNLDKPKCAKADHAYRHGVAYAVKTLAMPNVAVYLDAAHAGWLGWGHNRDKMAKIYTEVLAEAGGAEKIRGFATNVANYDSLEGGDLHKLEPTDPCPDELSYIKLLDASLTEAGIKGKAFIIDTSRNGRDGIRTKSGSWCNVKGAGLGARPVASPAPFVDAYFWLKDPGESDGGGDASKPGFDKNCGPDNADAAPNAPHGGDMFPSYLVDLVKNANPPL
jgi:cellulose 1,4-beta-cellobiosidase